jgi:L-ribulose-5-phosphate 3-epimerase
MSRIAIMQGRLGPPEAGRFQSFPRQGWRREFSAAAAAGLDAIEWIYDLFGEDVNPLGSDDGILEMQRLGAQHGVGVVSVCADYFMDRPFLRVTDGQRADAAGKLRWLLQRCRLAGISRAVLPFVDQSRIDDHDEATRVVETLGEVLPDAERYGVELHLETALDPAAFAALLTRVPHSHLKVNYDSGNSASLGYQPREEFAAYGSRIGSVHIKDRVRGGGTVPLGQGDADLAAVFDGLQRIGYQGDYVLQVARGEPHGEVALARSNIAIVAGHLRRNAQGVEGGRR